jgi:hypothetical protein
MSVMLESFQFEHHMYIHNVFGHFFKNTLDYFSDYLYPRFQYKVIGTYDKAVEYITKTEQYGREVDKPNLPALILNPSGEFLPSDRGGKQFWRFPNLQGGYGSYLYDPVYKDINVMITVAFSRLKGEMELIILPSSFYEYCDLRLYLLQIFGGTERPIYPITFNTNIIMPDNFIGYKYNNTVQNINYTLDWNKSPMGESLIKSINKELHVLPCKITPWFVLTGMSDGSERYGGTDKLAEWRLVLNIDYEIEVPSFIIMTTDMMLEKINFNFLVGNDYSYNNYKPQTNIFSQELFIEHINLDSTSTVDLSSVENVLESEELTSETKKTEYILKNRFIYIITDIDTSSDTDITIDLPNNLENLDKLIIVCKDGRLFRGHHFDVSESLRTITIYREHIYEGFIIGDIYEIFEYELRYFE